MPKIVVTLEYNFIVDPLSWILTLSITAGQLVKIPIGQSGGLAPVDLAVIFLGFLGMLQIKFKLQKPPIFIKAAGLFIAILLVSLVFTPLHLDLSQYLTAFFYIVRFSLYLLLGWVLLSGGLASLKENISKVLLFSGIGLAVLGLLQFLIQPDLQFLESAGWDPHYFRTVSTFLDPNFAGAFFVLTLLVVSHLRGGTILTPRVFVIFLALLTTFSRSSYLMFLVCGSSLAFLEKSKTLFFKTLLLFIVLILGFQVYTQLVAKPRNIEREKSASFRLNTWQQGYLMFQHSPLLGVGYNAYRFALKEYNLGDGKFIQSHGASSNDSSLLFVAATTGIIGLLSYLFFLFSLIKYSWGKNLLPILALAGLIIHSFFANSLFYPPILAWIILSAVSPKK